MAGIGSMEEAEPIIRNNRCEKNAMAGIGSQLHAKPVIVNNKCIGNAAAGIGLRPGVEGIVIGNDCLNNKLVAIGLPEKGRAVIVGNKLSREGGMPPLVAVKGGSSAVMVDNELHGGGVAGILVDGKAVLVHNKITGRNEKFGHSVWLWKDSEAVGAGNEMTGFKAKVTVSEGASWQGKRPE